MQRLRQSPTDPAFVQDPYPFYDRARAAGPFFFWEEYGLVCATSAAGVTALVNGLGLALGLALGRWWS